MNGEVESGTTLPHCKGGQPGEHVAVAVTPNQPWQVVTATHVDHLACKNTDYTGPGVVISIRKGEPLRGLHLLPELLAWLPSELRSHAAAARSGQTVTILHTVNKILVHFAALLPAKALELADAVEAAE